jgi:hypothetical protein
MIATRLFAVALLAMGMTSCQGSATPAQMMTINYPPAKNATANLLNPERGFYMPLDLIGGDDFGAVRAEGYTLMRAYARLDEWRDRDLPQSFLDALDTSLNAVRAAGVKIILRFAYNFGPYPDSEPDASKAQMLRHMAQLKPTLQKHADVIAWMETGFVGAWGEWHTSTHGIDKDMAAKREIVAGLLDALPASRMIQLRYPTDIIRMMGDPLTPAEAFTTTAKARVGHHNDCFLASDDDWGTYNRDGSGTRKSDQAYLAQLTRFTPMSGETCNPNPPRSDCPTTLQEMTLLHYSSINLGYHPDVVRGWREQGCFDEIRSRLGYQLALQSAELPAAARAGQSVPLSITLENSGFAAPVNPRDVVLVLDGPARFVQPLEDIDPRRWEPGTHTFTATLQLPANAPAGDYRLGLWLPDPAPALRNDPRYAIRLSNDGVWDETAGFNVLLPAMKIR